MAAGIFALLGFVSVLYGLLIFRVGSGTGFFAVWMLSGAAFFGLSVSLWTGHLAGFWNHLPLSVRRGAVFIGGLVLALFFMAEGLILTGFRDGSRPDLDYIIVLGAQVRENGPSIVLKYRLDKACQYLEENPETVCIVSGGQGSNEPTSEAAAMAAYLSDRGIDESRILQEDRSHTTFENLKYSARLLSDPEKASIGIVTNNFHMYRAMRTARRAGLKNVCAIPSPSSPAYLPNNMLREFLGLGKGFLTGTL